LWDFQKVSKGTRNISLLIIGQGAIKNERGFGDSSTIVNLSPIRLQIVRAWGIHLILTVGNAVVGSR
jgi:hypothetical protein